MPRLLALRLVLPSLLLGAVAGCATDVSSPDTSSVDVQTQDQAVIYGEDDRMDWYAHPSDAWREVTTESIVALIRPGNVDTSNPDDVRIVSPLLGPSRNLCEDQRFFDQPRAANCSGTLIDRDLVLTAGHCIDDLADCQNYRYVFDYYYAEEGRLETITADDVYRCEELVVRRLDSGIDYAIVRLDRPTTLDRVPAPVREGDEPIAVDTLVPIVGFGSGLPAKIDTGGRVTVNRADQRDWFRTTNDAFGGNSGSGVFNEFGEVVGILVRGAQDYTERGECTVVNVLDEDSGAGEEVVYVARAIEDLCSSTDYEGPLCGGLGGWCRPCEETACEEGFTCVAGEGELASLCGLTCETDEDCRADHACDEDGECRPRASDRCFDGDVWTYDACGRRLALAEECAAAETCFDGSCLRVGDGNTCGLAAPLTAEDQVVEGTLGPNYGDTFEGSCGGAGRDVVYTFAIERDATVTATVSGYDTVLYLRGTCDAPGTEVACNDDNTPPGEQGSQITVDLEPGRYFIYVDSFRQGGGDYTLELDFDQTCECALGDTRCDGTGLRTCVDEGGECPVFGDVEACPGGQTCVDGGCVAQSDGDTCDNVTDIEATSQTLTGDLSTGYGDDLEGSCGGVGADAIYRFEVPTDVRMTATATGTDTVLHLREACDDPATEIACNDDTAGIEPGSRFVAQIPAGEYYLIVDGGFGAAAWQLELTFEEDCVDACDADGDFECVGAESYRVCGQFDADSCLDWGEEACGAGLRCSARDAACVDPGGGGGGGDTDAGTGGDAGGTDDAGTGGGGGGGGAGDADGGATSGGGGGGGCAAAPSRGAMPGLWLALVGLAAVRRRR